MLRWCLVNRGYSIDCFCSRFICSTDVDGVGTILPLAALLTGAFLTLGVGVLLVVVLAIRKRRGPAARSICDDKDKHLGKSDYGL